LVGISAGFFRDPGEQATAQCLQRPAELGFASEQHGQAARQKGQNNRNSHAVTPLQKRGRNQWSIATCQLGHVDRPPTVLLEVEKLDLAKQGDWHGLDGESPVIGVGPQLEPSEKQTYACSRRGAGDER
jgi:hypothetical protein